MVNCTELCSQQTDLESQITDQESVITIEQEDLAALQAELMGVQMQIYAEGCDCSMGTGGGAMALAPVDTDMVIKSLVAALKWRREQMEQLKSQLAK